MKRLQLVLAAVLALLASFIVAAPASHAADVTFVQGITNGKFGEYQAFDVSRVPSNPLCTNSVPDEFKVTVKDPASPNTGASGGP